MLQWCSQCAESEWLPTADPQYPATPGTARPTAEASSAGTRAAPSVHKAAAQDAAAAAAAQAWRGGDARHGGHGCTVARGETPWRRSSERPRRGLAAARGRAGRRRRRRDRIDPSTATNPAACGGERHDADDAVTLPAEAGTKVWSNLHPKKTNFFVY